ncbi:MAG: hypothetical protein ACI86M_001099 [Saprospiraceae bacterium]|jgi:hypothetical protein
MTKPNNKYCLKQLTILCLCISYIQLSTSQEITFETSVGRVDDGPKFKKELIENNGKYYWFANNVDSNINNIIERQ